MTDQAKVNLNMSVSKRQRELPTQLIVINSELPQETIRNSAFELNLRPHFVRIEELLDTNPHTCCVTSFSDLKELIITHKTTNITDITPRNSLFLLPKSWFNDNNRSLFADFAKLNVLSIGKVTYFELSNSIYQNNNQHLLNESSCTSEHPKDNPLLGLYNLSKKLQPRYCLVLKTFSFIIKIFDQEKMKVYYPIVSLIRWMGGLVREEINPRRHNQVLITDAPKGKQYQNAQTLDLPVSTIESIQNLWKNVEQDGFNSEPKEIMEYFRSHKVLPFTSSILHFPSQCFPENELKTLEKRTLALNGEYSDVINDNRLTHIIVDKKQYETADWIEFLESLKEIYPNIGNPNNTSQLSESSVKSPFIVKIEWFWESVKAEVKANESDHLINILNELRPESALSCCDISGSTAKDLAAFSTKGTLSPVTSQEHLLGRNGPVKYPSRDQLLAESKESQEEPGENSLILPGYGRKAQDLKINNKNKSRQSLQPEILSKNSKLISIGLTGINDKLKSFETKSRGVSRETPSNLERTFDVVHESRESSFLETSCSNQLNTKERIAKAASCSLLDQIQLPNETEDNFEVPTGNNIQETSSPVLQKHNNFIISQSPQDKLKSECSSREKSLDDLSNSNKRKSCETLDEKKSRNSDSQTSHNSREYISPKPSKIDRKYTILNSPNRSKSEEGLLNVVNNSKNTSLTPITSPRTPQASLQNTPKLPKRTPEIVEKDEHGNFTTVSQEEIKLREKLKAQRDKEELKQNNENCRKEFRMPVLKLINGPGNVAQKSKRYMIIKEFYDVEKNYLASLSFIIREMKMSLEEDYREKRDALKSKFSVTGYGGGGGVPEEDMSVLHHDYTINFEPDKNFDTTFQSSNIHHTRQPSEASQVFSNQLNEQVILPITEIRALFSKVDKIYTVHCGLLMDLNEFLDNWEENQNNSVGSIMEPYIARFQEVYPPYLNYYEDISENFKRCLQEFPKFEAHCKLVESKRNDKCTMKDLMIQPVQRLTRYPLIFQRLMQVTQKECKISHPDNKCLEDITKLLEGATSTVNETKRETENFQKIFSLSTEIERFPPDLVSAKRKYIYAFDAVHLQRWNANQTKPPKTKRVRIVILSDFIIICHKQRNTFTRKTRWSGKPQKKYLFYKKIKLQSIMKILVNESSRLEENIDSTGNLRRDTTSTFSDLSQLKSSSSFTNLNRTFGTTQGVNHLCGIGFVWPLSIDGQNDTGENDFEFFGINKDGFRNKHESGKLSISSNFGVGGNGNDFQGGSMGTLKMPDGTKIKTNAQYISCIKNEIVKLVSDSKGKLGNNAEWITAVTAQHVIDLHRIEAPLTPYESVSDLSVKSQAWSTCTDEYGGPNRENRTPSPTSSVASVQSSMGIGYSEHTHRNRYPSQKSDKLNTSKFGRGSLSTKGIVRTLKESWKSNKLTRNISFSKSPIDGGRNSNKHSGGFLTPVVPGQKKKHSVVRNRSATRPEICHANNPAKQTIPANRHNNHNHHNPSHHQFAPMETGYTSNKSNNNLHHHQSSLPRCQTTGSLTPTRNIQSNPMNNNQSNTSTNQQNYVNQSKNNHYLSQQVPSSSSRNNIPTKNDSVSPQYSSTANQEQQFSNKHNNNSSGKTNNNNATNFQSTSSSTPPGSKPQLHNLTRNHFIASTATPPPEGPQIHITEPTTSATLTSSLSYSPGNSTLKNSTVINSTLV